METLIAGVLVMVIEFGVIEERRDEFVEISAERVQDIRSFEGNQSFDILIDDARPGVVVYVERWADAERQAAFYDWWVAQGMTERLRPLVTGAPKISTYRVVAD